MILVTGSTGGLGSDLCDLLDERGVLYARARADVTDRARVIEEVERVRPDVVMHLAALVGTKDCDEVPAQAIRTNVDGTYNVVAAAVRVGARVVYYSSSAIFLPGVVPLRENSPVSPTMRTIYGATKYWGEQLARKYVPARDLIVLRPCMGFGGRKDRVSQLVALIRSHWTRRPVNLLLDMNRVKDYCPVRNISEAAYRVAVGGAAWGETFNVGFGRPEMYADTIRGLRHRGLDPVFTVHPEHDFLGDHVIDTSKLRDYGWAPTVDRDEAIDAAVAACRAEME